MKRHVQIILILFYAAVGLLGARLLLPWLAPFGLAWLLGVALEKPVGFLTRRLRLPRSLAAGLCTLALCALLAALLGLLAWRGWYEGRLLLSRLPALLSDLPLWMDKLEERFYRLVLAAPIPVQEFLRQTGSGLLEGGLSLSGEVYTWLLDRAGRVAAALPDVALFIFTTFLAAFFITAQRPALLRFLKGLPPRRWRPTLARAGAAVRDGLGGWLRAQGILLLITFGVLAVGLLLMGVELALLIAAGTALLDALPVFGTGVVLLPWGLACLLKGEYGTALGLGVIYLLITLSRTLLEPKLVGKRAGLHPLAALMAMYGGFRLFGVVGMILAPLAAVVGKRLYDAGLFGVWRAHI